MRWRPALGVALAVLLALPMVLLLHGSLNPGLRMSTLEQGRVSPVLSFEERMRRVTYHRPCQQSSECEVPMGCLSDVRARTHYCTDSQCLADEQCPEGQVCRSLATTGGGPLVRLCVPLGARQEAERCINLPDDKGAACGPGLLCAGHEGWCARPCGVASAASCPAGFFCAQVAPEPVCLPTCATGSCPEGQQCIQHEEGASACAVVHGPTCQQSPCPEGRECQVLVEPRRPREVWTECVERCGEGRPPCSPGSACDGWHCLPACTPQAEGACPEGYRCEQSGPDRPWVCQPDL